MGTDFGAMLLETTLAVSAAMAVVLSLRGLVRRGFGAGAAYALWLLVPAALLAVMLPAAAEPVMPALVSIAPDTLPAAATALGAPAAGAWTGWAWLWAAGALATLVVTARSQVRFVAGLGPLHQRPDGHWQSLSTRGLPAVLGWRPRIVLPGDFEQRYGAEERDLVLAHEQVHLRRGDLAACALAAALRVLFWFNPLLWLAAGRFRHDQELACDQAVLRRFPDRRRTYADAMLKTRLADRPLPLGCHWFGSHPLKERIAMLNRPLPSFRRRLAGGLFVLLAGLATATVAWATQSGGVAEVPPGKLLLVADFKVDDDDYVTHTMRAVLAPGEAREESFEHEGQAWATTWSVTPLADGTFDISATLRREGEEVGKPRLITDEQAAIGIGSKDAEGRFTGLMIELRVQSGPPAPGMAAVGIEGRVPAYPAAAVAAGEGGVVMLKVLVGADGRAQRVEFVPGESTVASSSSLVHSTLEAARQWTFTPETKDGVPVAGWVQVPVQFDPQREAASGG